MIGWILDSQNSGAVGNLIAIIATFCSLVFFALTAFVVYPWQKKLDRKMELQLSVLPIAESALGLANQFRAIIDLVCMDTNKLHDLPNQDEFKRVRAELDQAFIALTLRASPKVANAARKLQSLLSSYRATYQEMHRAWERASASYSDNDEGSGAPEVPGPECDTAQFQLGLAVKMELASLSGLKIQSASTKKTSGN